MNEKLKSVFTLVFGISQSDIFPEISPQNFSSWDSLKHMNLIVSIEDAFGIEFDEDEFANMTSFEKIAQILSKKLN